MTSRWLVLPLVGSLLVGGCSTPTTLRVQATVADDLVVVSVPALASPPVNLDAGFVTVPGDPAGTTMGSSTASALTGLGSTVAVATTDVGEGDQVTAGQQLAVLDDRLLRAGLAAAEADAGVATAQVDVLETAIRDATDAQEEVAEKRVEVADALRELKERRSDVEKAIKNLTRTRADLLKQRSQARAARADLIAKRKQAQNALAALPPPPVEPPPGVPTREELEAAIAQLTAGIKRLDAGLKKMAAGLKQLDKGLRQARQGLSRITDGIAAASDGLRDLDDAAAELRDARAELTRLRRLAAVAADTASVPVELARTRLAEATITSPVAGTVVSIAAAGDRLAPGAGLVTIRRSGPSRLVTWLSPAQAATVCLGDTATVHTDWGDAVETAELSRLATAAEFPPTWHATDEVHLTRAFRVELTIPTPLPAGVPATLSIQPCRPAATGAP